MFIKKQSNYHIRYKKVEVRSIRLILIYRCTVRQLLYGQLIHIYIVCLRFLLCKVVFRVSIRWGFSSTFFSKCVCLERKNFNFLTPPKMPHEIDKTSKVLLKKRNQPEQLYIYIHMLSLSRIKKMSCCFRCTSYIPRKLNFYL